MKIYAELHGDMQKPRIKSRDGNKMDAYSMLNTNLAFDGIEELVAPISHITDTINPAFEALDRVIVKEGDRPYRVNSVNISCETTLSQSAAVTYLTAEGATHRR